MPKDYSKWRQVNDISVVDMQLDLKNPRMPDYHNLTQSDVILIMSEKYKVLDIAKSIGQRGYIPRENIIIVYENKKPVVLEGNRRVTALKLIINPELAPIADREEYRSINGLFASVDHLKFPPVIVVPSRKEVDSLILDKHTENTEIPWKPIMQSRFYKTKQAEYGGVSTKELAEILGTTESKIREAYVRLSLYDAAVKAVQGTSLSKKVEDAENFEITTLERIIIRNDFYKRLNISISHDSLCPANETFFLSVLGLLVQWMYKAPEGCELGKITSRSANSAKQIQAYIDHAIAEAGKEQQVQIDPEPEQAKKDCLDATKSNESSNASGSNSAVENREDVIPPISERKQKSVTARIVNDLSIDIERKWFGIANEKLLEEVYGLGFKTAPTMIVAGTRMLLERSIRRFLFKNKTMKIKVNENGKNVAKIVEEIHFKLLLEYLYSKEERLEIPSEIKKSLRRFAEADQTQVASLATLNNIFHASRSMTPSNAKEIWEQVSPLIEFFACQNTKSDGENNFKGVD